MMQLSFFPVVSSMIFNFKRYVRGVPIGALPLAVECSCTYKHDLFRLFGSLWFDPYRYRATEPANIKAYSMSLGLQTDADEIEQVRRLKSQSYCGAMRLTNTAFITLPVLFS